jgi:hypothetical protein
VEPISMTMMAISALASAGQGGLQAMAGFGQAREARRNAEFTGAINRERLRVLQSNADLSTRRGAFEAGKVRDQLEQVTGAQAGFFAAGNIDPTQGSPAFLAAQSAAQAELDVMAATARGMQGRADAFQQMANVQGQTADAWTGAKTAQNTAMIGAGTAFLNTASQWASLGMKQWGGGATPAAPAARASSFGPGTGAGLMTYGSGGFY